MEKTITMSLREYENLIGENDRMKKILKNKKGVAFELRSESMGMGWMRNTFNLISKDSIVEHLFKRISELEIENSKAWTEVYKLRGELSKKKSFF